MESASHVTQGVLRRTRNRGYVPYYRYRNFEKAREQFRGLEYTHLGRLGTVLIIIIISHFRAIDT